MCPQPPECYRRREFRNLLLIMVISMVSGLIYTFIVPPWQHYDEPGQFEYAWLIANRELLPQSGDFDQGIRREIAASMVEHGFFRDLDIHPNLVSFTEPVWIGISQTGSAPLYYWIAALPLWLFQDTDVTYQLYMTRWTSFLFYLATVFIAWGITREIFPPGHPLRWMVPASLALLPGFTDLMTAVNDDVGATVAFSLFLWISIRTLKAGFSWIRLAAVLGLALVCPLMKNTTIAALPLALVVILFSIFKGRRRRLAWLILASTAVLGIVTTITWGDADYWHRSTPQYTATRTAYPGTPHGKYAFVQVQDPQTGPSQIFQIIPSNATQKILGKTVTLGAYVWASEPSTIQGPILIDGDLRYTQMIEVGTQPVFYSLQAKVSENVRQLMVVLEPLVFRPDRSVTVYYDSLVLVEGAHLADQPPQFDDPLGREGVWGGQLFTNLIRNASAERKWYRVRPWVERLATFSPVNPSVVLTSLADLPGYGPYYWNTMQRMLQTFWAKFGWAHVPLLGNNPYIFLNGVTLLGLVGAVVFFIRARRRLPVTITFTLGLGLAMVWGLALVRGAGSLISAVLVPAARYANPVIIPSLLLLCLGWLEPARHIIRKIPKLSLPLAGIFLAFLLGLNIYAIVSILVYFG